MSDRSGDSLAAELEPKLMLLGHESKIDQQVLSPHAPEEPGANGYAPTKQALNSLGTAMGGIGSILVA